MSSSPTDSAPSDLAPSDLVADTIRFAFDTVDGETVVIDTVTGSLMLLTGIGPWIWECLATGEAVDALVRRVEAGFGAEAAGQVEQFMGALAEQQMLVAAGAAGVAGAAGAAGAAGEAGAAGSVGAAGAAGSVGAAGAAPEAAALPEQFSAPGLETFNEIADIIAMDPIHDVDPSRGWPHT